MTNDVMFPLKDKNFRVERPNEVAAHYRHANIVIYQNMLLITDEFHTEVALYAAQWWVAIIFESVASDDHS